MEKGRVIKVNNNKITIRLTENDACDDCGGCAIDQQGQATLTDVENTVNAVEGDTVIIDNKESSVVISALIMYVLPLVFLVGGYYLALFVAAALNIATYFSYIGALLSFVLSFWIVWLVDKRVAKSSSFKPMIVRKL